MKQILYISLLLLSLNAGAQTIYRGDSIWTFLNFPPNDSTVKANITITTKDDTGMLKWALDQTTYGDSIYFDAPGGIYSKGRIDSLMIFERNYFNETNNTNITFK